MGYSRGNENIPECEVPLFAYHASAGPTMGPISTPLFCDHTSLQFDSWAEDREGATWSGSALGPVIESGIPRWAPTNPIIPATGELFPSDYLGSENIQTCTEPSIFFGSCVGITTNTTATGIIHDPAMNMTSGRVDDYGRVKATAQSYRHLNSDISASLCELHTFERLPHAGGRNCTMPSGPQTADRPYEKTTGVRQARIACGWIKPDGMVCNKPIGYHCESHFATAHGITNMSSEARVRCRWCPLGAQKEMNRKGFIRHVREVHMKYQRSKNKRLAHLLKRQEQFSPSPVIT